MRLLLVVNSSASSVTARGRVVIQKALSADHEVTVAETNRRGHATRLAQGAARRRRCRGVPRGRRHPQRGRERLGPHGHGAGAAAGRVDQRLRSHDRAAQRPHRGHRRAARRARGRQHRRCRPRVGQRPLLPLPRRPRLRRRGRPPGGAALGPQALRRPPASSCTPRSAYLQGYDPMPGLWFALRVHAMAPAPTSSTTGYCRDRPEPTNPYTYLGNRPFNVMPEATLDRGLAVITLRSLKLSTLLGAVASSLGLGGELRKRRHIDVRTDLEEPGRRRPRPFPYQVDCGDHLGDTELLRFAPRARRPPPPRPAPREKRVLEEQ